MAAPTQETPASPPAGPPRGGPPPQEQIDGTLAWVSDVFRDYYRGAPPPMPPRFARREFGFIWIGKKFFLRHTGFSSRDAFQRFLVHEAPHHAYYSTAYYKTPGLPTMKEKEWLGADLIFDLDADHLPDADKLSFEEQLVAVKKQARKLLHDFLLGDFGFDTDHVRIVFSGGRGYHFHVSDPRVLQLDSAARREIVDYVSPNETVFASLYEDWITEKAVSRDKFKEPVRQRRIASAAAPGWLGRLTRTLAMYLRDLGTLERGEAERRLRTLPGIGPATARNILDSINKPDARGYTALDRLFMGEASDAYGGDGLSPVRFAKNRDDELERYRTSASSLHASLQKKQVIEALVDPIRGLAQGETDEPVTADIKRLIRLPGSLHGKTGLRVTPLTVDEFERFDPLRDAVALSDEPTRVVVSKPVEVRLKGTQWKVASGEQDLPLHLAMFLALRRSALRPLA